MIDTEQTKGERAAAVPPGADGFESQSRQVRLLLAHGAKPGIERRAKMERLTQWYDDGKIRGVLVKDGYEENALQTIVTKIDECYAAVALLKEYEDTELTPEQIISIATELKEYKQLELSPKRLSEHIAFCRRYHELFGAIDFNRLMEWSAVRRY